MKKKYGGYGKGKVVERITRTDFQKENEEVAKEKGDERDVEDCEKVTENDVDKVTKGIQKFVAAVVEFGQVMADVGSKQIGKEFVKKTFSKMSEMLSNASSSQDAQETPLLDDDPIFNDENFIAAVQALEDAVTKTIACPNSPNWDLLTPSTAAPTPVVQEKTFLESVIEESESNVEDVQYRERKQRKFKNLPLSLRFPYWTAYNEKLSNVTEKEKLMSDYAFLEPNEEHRREDMLFKYKDFYIARDLFLTLSGKLEKNIIDVWCLRMNLHNVTRGVSAPKCVYFTTNAVDLNQPKVEATLPEGLLSFPLLRHQRIALAWMLQKETSSVHCLGGILADDQGLRSMIALIQFQRSSQEKAKSKNVGVIKAQA